MKREVRNLIHKKKEGANSVTKGVPSASELAEGVVSLRFTNEGLVQYVKYNGQLYKREFIKANDKEGIEILT